MPSKFINYVVEDVDLLEAMGEDEAGREEERAAVAAAAALSNQQINKVSNQFRHPPPLPMPVPPQFLGGGGSNPSLAILKAASVVGMFWYFSPSLTLFVLYLFVFYARLPLIFPSFSCKLYTAIYYVFFRFTCFLGASISFA